MAHVFQMMAGATKNSPITFRGLQSARTSDSPFEVEEEGNPFLGLRQEGQDENVGTFDQFDSTRSFDLADATGRMCTCPVCRNSNLLTLSELGSTPSSEDEDGYVVPDVQIGATGIVMPGRNQLVRWFKTPVVPKMSRSKLHVKAKMEAKHHGFFAFFSTFSFETVFFTPCPSTILLALTTAGAAAYRTYSHLKKAANTEDSGIKLELKVRVHAVNARSVAWQKLFYCTGCGMVHDREGKRSLPWYSMLQLVHYPEQEFEAVATPVQPVEVAPISRQMRNYRVA